MRKESTVMGRYDLWLVLLDIGSPQKSSVNNLVLKSVVVYTSVHDFVNLI
jgi:hypothetical protein